MTVTLCVDALYSSASLTSHDSLPDSLYFFGPRLRKSSKYARKF